ncbi:helix-turn-helix domain-containing protein [Winogradskyella sp.]|uniref:helix-turn-helix domain-containing protein n=1 Tax=Winogradskyella sp. TaxID=1883156 RepID=UPI003BABA1AE
MDVISIFTQNHNVIDTFLDGIKFLLGLQLILVAVIHFVFSSDNTRIILAFLCLILGLWFFQNVYQELWENNGLYFLFIGPGKSIFVAPLLYLFYISHRKTISNKFTLKHLGIPLVYFLTVLLFEFILKDAYNSYKKWIFSLSQITIFIVFSYYFFVTRYELRNRIKRGLLPRAYKKVMFLFYSLYFFLLQMPIWKVFTTLVNEQSLSASFNHKSYFTLGNFAVLIGEFIPIAFSYFYLLGYVLFLYALSESHIFKKLFSPRDISFNHDLNNRIADITEIIQAQLINDKMFKDSKLNVEKCAQILNISKKELMEYLRVKESAVFNDYINRLRVDEFKSLVRGNELKNYNLVGLAKECGFNSKSTFFRVFKDIEGVTPNQFKKSIERLD